MRVLSSPIPHCQVQKARTSWKSVSQLLRVVERGEGKIIGPKFSIDQNGEDYGCTLSVEARCKRGTHTERCCTVISIANCEQSCKDRAISQFCPAEQSVPPFSLPPSCRKVRTKNLGLDGSSYKRPLPAPFRSLFAARTNSYFEGCRIYLCNHLL